MSGSLILRTVYTFLWILEHVSDLAVHLISNLLWSEGLPPHIRAGDGCTHDTSMGARVLSGRISNKGREGVSYRWGVGKPLSIINCDLLLLTMQMMLASVNTHTTIEMNTSNPIQHCWCSQSIIIIIIP